MVIKHISVNFIYKTFPTVKSSYHKIYSYKWDLVLLVFLFIFVINDHVLPQVTVFKKYIYILLTFFSLRKYLI